LGVIEMNQDLSRLDAVAIENEDMIDGTAFLMLNRLYVAVDNERASGNHGAVQMDSRRKTAENANENQDDGEGNQCQPPDCTFRGQGTFFHHCAAASWVG
jgi:hypothetical protein